MSKKSGKASLSKGRSSWCVIFRHPICQAADKKQRLRVRRGLGTSDQGQAQQLVDQLNEILDDPTMWTLGSRERAGARFDTRIVAAFFDPMQPEGHDPWAVRDGAIPLPGGKDADDGYARVQFVGTTGAGKTTVVRQLLGTDPDQERFPSISAAKTTICDIEIVMQPGNFDAVVTFIPRDRVRQYIEECVSAAIASKLENASDRDVLRRFLEHSEQRFRLSYILGNPMLLRESNENELSDDGDSDDSGGDEDAELSDDEKKKLLETLDRHLDQIRALAESSRDALEATAREFGIKLGEASKQDREVLQSLIDDQMAEDERFHELIDAVLEDVEERFYLVSDKTLERGRDGWPLKWVFSTDDRREFIKRVNQFSSNYAPSFGRLLTPLVEGIRVAGPFSPEWGGDNIPKLVLMDGQGIGHTADSTSSLSTSITSRFQIADAIVLVDNAAQPMQAAPCAVLQTLVASGHESKLIVTFTHFDEVKGDNLKGLAARKDHVLGSFDNAAHALGKAFGREAESALRRLVPDRIVFLANIQKKLEKSARLTQSELGRLLTAIASTIQPVGPVKYKPVYDVANLVLTVQKATQEYHDCWKGILGLGTRSGVAPEHWTRVKALTRRLGIFHVDEYDTMRPVADLIRLLQVHVSQFLSSPLAWEPSAPAEDSEVRQAAIDMIRKEVFTRLHGLSRRRLLEERLSGWVMAYEHRGEGSTRVRARDIVTLYEEAAPVPNEMPGPDANEFLFEIRELIAESVQASGGILRGWTRSPDLNVA